MTDHVLLNLYVCLLRGDFNAQPWYSHEPDFVCQAREMKENSAHIFISRERSIILVFRQEEWLVEEGDDPLYMKFWAKLTASLQKRRFSIYALVTPQL